MDYFQIFHRSFIWFNGIIVMKDIVTPSSFFFLIFPKWKPYTFALINVVINILIKKHRDIWQLINIRKYFSWAKLLRRGKMKLVIFAVNLDLIIFTLMWIWNYTASIFYHFIYHNARLIISQNRLYNRENINI